MQLVTHKIALEIASAALDYARNQPTQYFAVSLYREVEAALVGRGYRSTTVLCMDGVSIRSKSGVASEVYGHALLERDPIAWQRRADKSRSAWRERMARAAVDAP